ncbi:glycolate oxidase subunit GlcD [Amorphoplanes nipponensis]|uniref:Glycolate oxidase subunit GlcD n=1 Tax=Actinoplanes nipponensis TaxID=135950 RepID=A0A919MJB6_9ACTN|nr:FAD-linked oxidase C-terminal domain-containing protein [Actinoplanes nipponensis]GIE47286.1 glycolate oxidase subunit GlcD [Actinoplanes nipponensis]
MTGRTAGAVDEQVIDRLRDAVGARWVRTDAATRRAYARDATPLFDAEPDVVVQPGTTAEVAAVVRIAAAHGVPVVARGAGTNLCAATVATHGGIVLSATRMDRLLEVSEAEQLAVVQPGVTTTALATAAAAAGLLYPPDPGSRAVSTIGGNVATCAGGLRGLKYGVTRNYVLGTEAVLGTGEIIRTGGRLVKDVAGYDLTRLLVGSEGTLAVLTEITVALVPAPPTAGYGVAYFDSLADAGRAVAAVVGAGLVPATLEFLDATCIEAVESHAGLGLDRGAGALLLFGDDGAPAQVDAALATMVTACRDAGARAVTTAPDVATAEDLLAARRCTLPALSRLGSLTVLEDVSVPRPRLAEAVARIGDIARGTGVRVGVFGHAGDGNLHPTAVADGQDPAQVAAVHRTFEQIFQLALDLGGTITGEHGVGAAKLAWLPRRLDPAQLALMRRLKAAFDPAGILNPGKLGS